MENQNFKMEQFNQAVLEGKATWWQMELPSGKVIFGENKAKMLGYPETNFKVYQDFMALVHPDDISNTMQAMMDHINGKVPVYETVYRIEHKNGEYIKFYDCGQIIKKDGDNITIMGFVMRIFDDTDIFKQMKNFKELIINGNPSIIELVAGLRR